MQNKHQIFFLVLGVPTLGEGGGSTWLGQIPKFFQKLDLKAPLSFCADRIFRCECELFRHEQRDSAKRTSTGKGAGEEVFSGVPIVRQLHQSHHERVTGDPEPEGYTNYINRCEILKKILS